MEPYVTGISAKLNGLTEPRPTSTVAQSETSIKSSMARLSVAQNSEASVKSTTVGRIPIAQSNDSTTKETKLVPCMFLIHEFIQFFVGGLAGRLNLYFNFKFCVLWFLNQNQGHFIRGVLMILNSFVNLVIFLHRVKKKIKSNWDKVHWFWISDSHFVFYICPFRSIKRFQQLHRALLKELESPVPK